MNPAIGLAEKQLREIADLSGGTVVVHGQARSCGSYNQFQVSIRFDGLSRVDGGLPVKARERFLILVPPTFPFESPSVETLHSRFAGFNHVHWCRQLCIYGSSSDWHPEDGMYGFIKQLDLWIRDAAMNRLDPDDLPLHPPVTYRQVGAIVVPTVDAPPVVGSPWVGLAELRERSNRSEIVAWKKLGQKFSNCFAPAILLHESFPFEYPTTVGELLDELESHGVGREQFDHFLIQCASHINAKSSLKLIIGTPMRRVSAGGPVLQHLAAWQISTRSTEILRKLGVSGWFVHSNKSNIAKKRYLEWVDSANVSWCRVHEMRPEVTNRRDFSCPMNWFEGKRVAIWGCGAIGTHVAESVVRAGASSVQLVDNKTVTPGILVRQSFEDDDIGKCKAQALSKKLKRINPDLETIVSNGNLVWLLTLSDPIPKVDLIIDCTASSSVRNALEYVLQDLDSRPPIASLTIDSNATSAFATLSTPEHSGGPLDLARQLKLEACRKTKLAKMIEAFWPQESSSETFQPEPGCSEPTFIGSNADLAAFSARMLNALAHAIATPTDNHTAAGWFFESSGPVHNFEWLPDQVLRGENKGYSVRVSPLAVREMRGWTRRSVRTAGKKIETGGLVFGQLNEAAKVLWVTEVDGPSPDSESSENHFTCGIDGMEGAARARHRRYLGSVECVGTWHTHPMSTPRASSVDISTVTRILAISSSNRRMFLMLILGGYPDNPVLGSYLFEKGVLVNEVIRIQSSVLRIKWLAALGKKKRNIGLALSGGGLRAIAFHLGCLRALYDLDLLDHVRVISSVSGGSIISAMYSYTNDSFSTFEERVVALLRRGLQRDILFELVTPMSLAKLAGHLFCNILRCCSFIIRCLGSCVSGKPIDPRHRRPSQQTFSCTEVFRNVIKKALFHDFLVRDVQRGSFCTVINATELRTGSAFRFGSTQSGCWRFGTINPEEALVADAVAASAAHPFVFAALDRKYKFTKNGQARTSRVLLTDGGVFENQGVGPMEPDRLSSISTNVFNPDYIICCDAGTGLFEKNGYSTCWYHRMLKSFLTVHRKLEDATRKRLHSLDDAGRISGFVLSYLGQRDENLPWIPAALPKRKDVSEYPTDFKSMSHEDIDRIALRGELLTRFLVAYYLPDI